MSLSAKQESNKSRVDSYSARNSVLRISHITFRDCRKHIFFRQPFQNQLYLLLSCLSQTKHFQILAWLVNRTLFLWSLWKLSSRVDFMGAFMHQQKQLSLSSTNLTLFHAAAFTLSPQKETLCVLFKPMAVPGVNVFIIISKTSI